MPAQTEWDWVYNVEKWVQDAPLPRIDLPSARDIDAIGLDPYMVGLACSTDHWSSKVDLANDLKRISEGGPVATGATDPKRKRQAAHQAIINRILYTMIVTASLSGWRLPNAVFDLLRQRLEVAPIPSDDVQEPLQWSALLKLDAERIPRLSERAAAQAIGVSRGTVRKWRDDAAFQEMLGLMLNSNFKSPLPDGYVARQVSARGRRKEAR